VFPDHLAARLPDVRAKHAALGLTDDESWATLRDIFRAHEVRGEVPFADVEWIERVWSGRVVELGRLQFEDDGAGVLSVHIPETGPLTPALCDASFARARQIFPAHHTAACTSWLLDPRLADALPADSNIVGFQRRFESAGTARTETRTCSGSSSIRSIPTSTNSRRKRRSSARSWNTCEPEAGGARRAG
jgi:hypothetical protein